MPTITGQTISDRAGILLNDTGATLRWSLAERLGYINDGQREVVALRPDTNSKVAIIIAVTGTRQSVPSDGYSLLSVVRNMGADGLTPGAPVRSITREQLDSVVPAWHSMNAAATTLHYVFDPRLPKQFWVYPPAVAGQRLELMYSAVPADLPSLATVITLDDIYAGSLLDYVLFRCYSKDAETPDMAARAVAHRQAFENSLGLKAQADASTAPPVGKNQ